jgi:electron transport complex protein RnfC
LPARRSITAVWRPSVCAKSCAMPGVVGLGGAVFPSHAKLTRRARCPSQHLVINGAECEPFMTCDDLLMRERAEEIVRGIAIFRDLLAARSEC